MHTVEKAWGKEIWLCNEKEYCAKWLLISPGKQCSLHLHPIKKETFVVIKGEVRLEHDGKLERLHEGDIRTILPKTLHRFGSYYGAKILEISTHHSDNDVLRTEPSGDLHLTP